MSWSTFLGKAQDSGNNNDFKHTHSAGLTILKTLPVFGVGYRYETKKRFMFDLDFGITKTNDAKVTTSKNHRQGVEISLLYEIGKPSRTDFYIYLANSIVHRKHQFIDSNNKNRYEDNLYSSHSIGVGVEFLILKKIGFNMSMYSFIYNKYTWVNLGAHLALYYKF